MLSLFWRTIYFSVRIVLNHFLCQIILGEIGRCNLTHYQGKIGAVYGDKFHCPSNPGTLDLSPPGCLQEKWCGMWGSKSNSTVPITKWSWVGQLSDIVAHHNILQVVYMLQPVDYLIITHNCPLMNPGPRDWKKSPLEWKNIPARFTIGFSDKLWFGHYWADIERDTTRMLGLFKSWVFCEEGMTSFLNV
jgi:hypothetical protein